jgi:hypothetical protein
MIHHVSISAKDPKHVADVLAELMNGRCYPFPGGVADSFMAVSGDEHGSMIEVYPESVTLLPGSEDDAQARAKYDATAGYVPFHLLLSVPVDRATVERIGEREGWRTRYFGRGAPGQKPFFHVIEFWLENRIMVEVATPDMVAEYTRMFRRETLDAMFSKRAAA